MRLLGIVIAVVLGGISTIFFGPLLKSLQPPPRPTLEPAALVWTNKNAGAYYCRDSILYGRAPGSLMKQEDALTNGYQPALGDYCHASLTDTAESGHVAGRRGKTKQGTGASTPHKHPPRASSVLLR